MRIETDNHHAEMDWAVALRKPAVRVTGAVSPHSRRLLLRIVVFALLFSAILALAFSPLRSHLTLERVRIVVAQLREVWYGPLVFAVLYSVGAVLVVPASVFVLSAGVIWGWKLGGLYALLGGTAAAAASFAVARFVGAGMLERFGDMGARVIRQADHADFKSLLILRLIPLFPFAVLNYGLGVAGVRFRDFLAATFLGMAPSAFVFTYSADALINGTLSREDAFKRLLIAGLLLAALVLLPAAMKKLLKRSLPPEQT